MEAESCPVVHIHKVTDSDGSTASVGKCPVPHAKKPTPTTENGNEQDEDNEFPDNPSYAEYKKIKRTMAMITNFYRSGSSMKFSNVEAMDGEIAKLEADVAMAEAQLKALEAKPSFGAHPKKKDYKRDLNEELSGLAKQKEGFLEKRKEFDGLYEWSKQIVKVCEWLEQNLDHYCLKTYPDLPEKVKESIKPMEELTPEQAKEYAKGLDEVVYNLQESQDFFLASVDGRLNKYHNIEQEIIEAQLEVIRKFPEDSARRLHVETELTKDLEYVKSLLVETPEANQRRHKMLKNHQDFFRVLKFNKEKLQAFGIAFDDQRKYDSKFDHYQD